jgi:hypothetical protein
MLGRARYLQETEKLIPVCDEHLSRRGDVEKQCFGDKINSSVFFLQLKIKKKPKYMRSELIF